MGAKKWEEYLWKDLGIVPIPDLKAGSIKLLDVFAQNGGSFPTRAMVRIGSLLSLGTRRWGEDKLLELWIVTELKYAGSFGYTTTRSCNLSANVHVPGAELVTTGVIVASALDFAISSVDSRAATDPTTDDILYGFKAVRVKFDKEGEYISRRCQDNMGKAMPVVWGDDAEFNPDEDLQYHMGCFFFESSGDEGAGTSSGDFECLPQFLIEDADEDPLT